jgi:hypothetical protein
LQAFQIGCRAFGATSIPFALATFSKRYSLKQHNNQHAITRAKHLNILLETPPLEHHQQPVPATAGELPFGSEVYAIILSISVLTMRKSSHAIVFFINFYRCVS